MCSSDLWDMHTIFARAEKVQKDELFVPPSPLTGHVFNVGKFSVGYVYDIPLTEHFKLGLGAVVTATDIPSPASTSYSGNPGSYMLFTRVKLH